MKVPVEVDIQRVLIDVKLPLANVSLMLLIGVVNLSTDLSTFNAEYLDAIREEQAIVKHIEFRSLDLLDVAVKFHPL